MKRRIRRIKRVFKAWYYSSAITIDAKISHENDRLVLIDYDDMHAWLSKKKIDLERHGRNYVTITMPQWYFIKHFENRYENRDQAW